MKFKTNLEKMKALPPEKNILQKALPRPSIQENNTNLERILPIPQQQNVQSKVLEKPQNEKDTNYSNCRICKHVKCKSKCCRKYLTSIDFC